MNESDFETLLKGISPAPPSATLRARVEHELELDAQWLRATPRKRAVRQFLSPVMWSAFGAAAAVVFMTSMPESAPAPAPALVAASAPVSSVMPVTTIREMLDAQDEGIQYNTLSNLPEQHVKLVSVERHAWIDPRDGAEITVEVPREDSFILPVSFQ